VEAPLEDGDLASNVFTICGNPSISTIMPFFSSLALGMAYSSFDAVCQAISTVELSLALSSANVKAKPADVQ
jgi:hypothetical protein